MSKNAQNIIIVFSISLLLVVAIGGWISYKTGEFSALFVDESEPLPGPFITNLDQGITMDDVNTGNQLVTFTTSLGDITLELFASEMPITVGNFVKLAEEGFYDNTKFHRVIDGFMIQGGDSNSRGDDISTYGQGGPGYTIEDEFVEGELLSNIRGTIAMANTGQPNSGGSQFFINLSDNTNLDFNKEPLSSKHPVFGRVVRGMDVVDRIAKVEIDARDIPSVSVVIESITLVENSDGD